MPYAETSKAEQLKQPYKFGDKELDQMHGLNHYDFSARYMDGIRFTSVDPLAEKKPWLTPYHYCSNNPINRIDPDGRYDGFPVPNTTYWQQAAVNYKQQEYIKENAPEIQRNAAAYTASLTDANDVVVLSTTITRGSDAINIDGTPASTLDKVAAAGGVFLPVVSGSLVAKGLKKLGKLFGFSLDATTSTAKGGRFISDTDGKIIDTKTTPKGSYTHPDGSRTDVLQDKSHFDKKTQTNTGTSHTHEPPQTNTNPTTGQTYTKKSENTHRPTYEEIKNIENGTAVKTK
jgi:RHS repeat-associated protein